MAEQPEPAPASSDGSNRRKLAAGLGLGLIGLGAYQLVKQGRSTPVAPPGSSPGGNASHFPIRPWLGNCRGDIVAGVQRADWLGVMGQYLREAWPDFLARSDILGAVDVGAWSEVEGQWLREHEPGYWNRADIVQAWYATPPRKSDVIGEYLKERGALACPGLAGVSSPPPSSLATTGGGAPAPAPLPAITSVSQLVPFWIVSTGCGGSDADYIVVPDSYVGHGLARIWIQDLFTWTSLGAPRNAIRIISKPVLYALPDRGTLVRQGVRGVGIEWVLYAKPFGYSPGFSLPPPVVKSNAGFCP